MEIITLSKKNIEEEHICCAISGAKNKKGVQLKKDWLKHRFEEGLVFKKMAIRGKVFIEYTPAEYAWRPIIAPGYIFIHCLWVSGKYKGQGYAQQLLFTCLEAAKDTNGVVVVSSKKTFLTDSTFFAKHGFECCDTAPPYFDLMVKKFKPEAPDPVFHENAKRHTLPHHNGLAFYYTDQCPFNAHYLEEMINVAKQKNIPYHVEKITSAKTAQQLPSAFGTFNVFYNGKFLTHVVMTAKSFEKMLDKEHVNNNL